MTAPRADLGELGRLLAAATSGPWEVAGTDGMGFALHRGEHDTVALYLNRDDAHMIAQTHNALPALLAEVADLRETVARVPEITEAACQRLRAYIDGYEGMCWCGFDSEDMNNDQSATLDHIVHSLVDDWRGFTAALDGAR